MAAARGKINQHLHCTLPCTDVNREFIFPIAKLNPKIIQLILVSEAPPRQHTDYYYGNPTGSFFQTTQTAFKDAGIEINSYEEITKMGIYLTTAIKCSKKAYLASADTIRRCSEILETEIEQFPNVKAILCMGDFSIKAINYISMRKHKENAILVGSTYKIRKEKHIHHGIRYFPSYTQTGKSFNIEKTKRRMIAEDIRNAVELIMG